MKGQQQLHKSRVIKVESQESWDFLLAQASDQGCPAAATKMEVKAMPTFVLMKGGNVMEKLVGANPDAIKRWIDGFVQTFHSHNNQALQ